MDKDQNDGQDEEDRLRDSESGANVNIGSFCFGAKQVKYVGWTSLLQRNQFT